MRRGARALEGHELMTKNDLPKKIAVLMGGPGSERDVSLATGQGISKALRSLGADVVEVDVRGENFELPKDVELAFIAVHGTFGEDGQIQQLLEQRGVAYTGEGIEKSKLAFDKIRSKEKFREQGVPTPDWETIQANARPHMQPPMVIKAPRQGSTVGVHIVRTAEEITPAIAGAAKYDSELLIEKFVSGRELTIGILGDQALPIIEIIPKGGFYDFTNKYPFLNPQAGGGAEHVCPAHIDQHKTAKIQELALKAFRTLGLEVYGRVDIILADTGESFVLEINTIPGMTEASLLPEAAAAAGIRYADLCARIIALSRARTQRRQR
jgi:D-alanine-D-alanine ligase